MASLKGDNFFLNNLRRTLYCSETLRKNLEKYNYRFQNLMIMVYSKCIYIVHLDYVVLFIRLVLNHIGGVMLSVLVSSAVDHGFEPLVRLNQRLLNWYLLLLRLACSIKEKEQRLVGSWNQNNVSRVERHVYPWTVVSVS